MTKVTRDFRFNIQLFNDFKNLAAEAGITATGAFERFMTICVEGGVLVFPEVSAEGFEAEAQVLVDWLSKGRRSYRTKTGAEMNITGRLVELLPKVHDANLRSEMAEALKSSVRNDS